MYSDPLWVTKPPLPDLLLLEKHGSCSLKNADLSFHPSSLVSLQRVAATPYTFKDGLHIPVGTTVSIRSYEIANEPDYFPNPETFSPNRYLNMGETSPHRYHFTPVSDDFLAVGSGAHACSGRFLAAYEIKIMIIELLIHFEMRFPKGQQARRESIYYDMAIISSDKVELLFKRRGDAEK